MRANSSTKIENHSAHVITLDMCVFCIYFDLFHFSIYQISTITELAAACEIQVFANLLNMIFYLANNLDYQPN